MKNIFCTFPCQSLLSHPQQKSHCLDIPAHNVHILHKNVLHGKGQNHNLVILDAAPVTIGDHVFIGPNCCISTAGHPFDVAQRNAGLEYAKPVTIGNNVWIGMGVQICPGVTIGDNAVIGAGSVVTEDIPAGMLAIGVPCKAVKQVANKPQRRIL